MLGDNLMALWFKPQDGYVVPEAPSRYVDMGMSFKRDVVEGQKHPMPQRKAKRKPGQLRELVYSHATNNWEMTQYFVDRIPDAARESIRNCLEALVKLGQLQTFGQYKDKQYRRKK